MAKIILGEHPDPLEVRLVHGDGASLVATLVDDTGTTTDWTDPPTLEFGKTGAVTSSFEATIDGPTATWELTPAEVATIHSGTRDRYGSPVTRARLTLPDGDDGEVEYAGKVVWSDGWGPGSQTPQAVTFTIAGPRGASGASAYELAVENGFVGTEPEWLDSLAAAPYDDTALQLQVAEKADADDVSAALALKANASSLAGKADASRVTTLEDLTTTGRLSDTGLSATIDTGIAEKAGVASPTPPSNPKVGQVWVSSAFADLRVSPSSPDRAVVIAPGTGEGDVVQEPSVWVDDTHYRMLSVGGNGLQYRTCPITSNPLLASSWTRVGTTPVLGGGVLVAQINHASLYFEGDYIYATGNVPSDNTIRMFRAPKSDPTSWTALGTIVPSFPSGSTMWGNTYLVKDGTGYVLFLEHKVADGRWQMGQWTSATINGTYTTSLPVMTSLYPDAHWSFAGGAWVTQENGQWVMIYHSAPGLLGVLPTEIFRATAPSLRADNWTLTDTSRPLIHRVGKFEVDQVADFDAVRGPNGVVYAFWAGNDNRAPMTGRIYGTRMLPTRKMWDGSRWVNTEARPTVGSGLSDSGLDFGITAATRPRLKVLTTDFSQYISSTSTWYELPGLGITYRPTGTDLEVEFRATIQLEGTGEFVFRVKTQSTYTWAMCAAYGANGNRVNVVGVARITRQQPGVYIPIVIEVQSSVQPLTIRCRPVSVPGKEQATVKVTEISYP